MIEYLTHQSSALSSALISGATTRTLPVYLPPEYQANRPQPYPVIFVLAGFGRRGAKYLADDNAYGKSLMTRLDEMILAEKMPATIVAFPDGTVPFGCSQYINSPTTGNFMDYLADELTDLIDRKYNTFATGTQRGVIGHSSGGFGALWLGMQRSQQFNAVTSLAGDCFFDVMLLPLLIPACIALQKMGGIQNFVDHFMSTENPNALPAQHYTTMMLLCLAGCFAPNKNVPLIFGDLFFDWQTGKVIPEVWTRYKTWDPLNAIAQHANALRNLKSLTLAAGQQDEYGLQLGQRQLSSICQQFNIKHELEEFQDRHSGYDWRLAEYIAGMARALVF